MRNYYGGHTSATSSRNVSRELNFCDPWRRYHGGMLILYKGLIWLVLEDGCIAVDRMAGTHMLKLEIPLFKDISRLNAIDSCSDA
jgi:hypothetical protein